MEIKKQPLTTRWVIFMILLVIPPVYLVIENQGLNDIFRTTAPDGQLYYLLSKLIGLMAFIVLCAQIVFALLDKIDKHKPPTSYLKRHIIIGSTLLVLILMHSGLFITAVSSRSGHINLHPLVPDFNSGYYNAAVSLGVLALLFTLIAVASGLLRKRCTKKWKSGHALIFVVMVLVCFHAWMIGSDVQSSSLLPLFLLAVVGVIVLAVRRMIVRLKN